MPYRSCKRHSNLFYNPFLAEYRRSRPTQSGYGACGVPHAHSQNNTISKAIHFCSNPPITLLAEYRSTRPPFCLPHIIFSPAQASSVGPPSSLIPVRRYARSGLVRGSPFVSPAKVSLLHLPASTVVEGLFAVIISTIQIPKTNTHSGGVPPKNLPKVGGGSGFSYPICPLFCPGGWWSLCASPGGSRRPGRARRVRRRSSGQVKASQ